MPETFYRELLADTRDSIKTVKKLMESKSEDVQVFAVEVFLKLSNLAAALAEVLGEKPERTRNPPPRRVRRHDRGGVK